MRVLLIVGVLGALLLMPAVAHAAAPPNAAAANAAAFKRVSAWTTTGIVFYHAINKPGSCATRCTGAGYFTVWPVQQTAPGVSVFRFRQRFRRRVLPNGSSEFTVCNGDGEVRGTSNDPAALVVKRTSIGCKT